MKITAKQVPPEWQQSPFDYMDWADMWPGIIIAGNRHFHSYTTPIFDRITERWDDEKTVLRALHLMTGKRHARLTIRGCCQGDWQEIYYPVQDYTTADITRLEIEYFDLGTEWEITRDDYPDDAYTMYCYADTNNGIRAEIAECEGVSPDDIALYAFDGWTQTPKYREV